MDYGPSDVPPRKNSANNNDASTSSLNKPMRRRSSLGLEGENTMGSGAGVPNPYGYAQREPRRKGPPPTTTPKTKPRRDSVNPVALPPGGRGIAGRGKSGVIGVVRQGSARMGANQGATPGRGGGPGSGAGRGGPSPGRGGRGGGTPGGAKQPRKYNSQQQQMPDKKKIQEEAARSSLLSQTDAYGQHESDGERSYGSLFYDEDASVSGESSVDLQGSGELSEESIPLMNVMDETNELRQSNADAKKDALVESLVWFSHHTPRTVLEDLVSHEIEIWQAERGVDMTIMEESCEDFEESSNQRSGSLASSSVHQKRKSDLDSSFMSQSQMEDSAVSDLSDEGMEFYDGNFSESILKLQQQGQSNTDVMIKLPKVVAREGAVVFADISGFTKLSTMLDCESLSKVINSYFDMIVNEVVSHGGDILKFAGDAFFAEWKVNDYDDHNKGVSNPLSNLNASLSTIQDTSGFSHLNNDDENIPKVATCVLAASKCAASIVEKFSDFSVGQAMPHAMPMVDGVRQEAILNVHCGIGAGKFVGLHVGDYKEDPDEEGVELRREFLVMGDPIDQAALAADAATDGEVLASPKALSSLSFCCEDMPHEMAVATSPQLIATRGTTFFSLEGNREQNEEIDHALNNEISRYEALRTHCRDLNQSALARLHLQMALYVHPVIRDDELALSAQIRQGKIAAPQSTIEDRHLAEAELRSVFTIFIKAVMAPKITWDNDIDGKLYTKLGDIMHVVSRELDRYSGHLRQFIVDDKGKIGALTMAIVGC